MTKHKLFEITEFFEWILFFKEPNDSVLVKKNIISNIQVTHFALQIFWKLQFCPCR